MVTVWNYLHKALMKQLFIWCCKLSLWASFMTITCVLCLNWISLFVYSICGVSFIFNASRCVKQPYRFSCTMTNFTTHPAVAVWACEKGLVNGSHCLLCCNFHPQGAQWSGLSLCQGCMDAQLPSKDKHSLAAALAIFTSSKDNV